jgi:hypothetical protein
MPLRNDASTSSWLKLFITKYRTYVRTPEGSTSRNSPTREHAPSKPRRSAAFGRFTAPRPVGTSRYVLPCIEPSTPPSSARTLQQRSAAHRAAALYRVHRRGIESWCVRCMHAGHDTNRRKHGQRAARRSGRRGAQGHAMHSPPASQCARSRGEEAAADRAALRHRRRRSPWHHSLQARTDSEELGRASRGMRQNARGLGRCADTSRKCMHVEQAR